MFKKLLRRNQFFSFNCYLCSKSQKINLNGNSGSQISEIQNFLGCTKNEAVQNFLTYSDLLTVSGNELNKRFSVLRDLKLADITNPECLGLAKHHDFTLRNRILSLQECGFLEQSITSKAVKKFLSLTHLKIYTLKKMLLVQNDLDMYKQLLEEAELMAHYTPYGDDCTIRSLKIEVIKLLLKHEIDMPDSRFEEAPDILIRLKNKSIRLIKRNIQIAKNYLRFSSNKICRNPFILWADPDNSMRLINDIKEIGGIDVTLCVSLYPKIIISTYENTKTIKQYLKDYNFTDAAIQRALCLFTLASTSVKHRLVELEKEEIFTVFRQHPRVLLLVYYFNKVKIRLELLKEINVTNTPLSVIFTTRKGFFSRYYEHGLIKQHGNDISTYICSELHCNKVQFYRKMRGCGFWRYVSTIEIAKNLKYLRNLEFKDEEILNNIHVLFYPNVKIIEALNSLDKKDGLEFCKTNEKINREYILPLCVYYIEKFYNFSSNTLCVEDSNVTHSDLVIPDVNKYVGV